MKSISVSQEAPVRWTLAGELWHSAANPWLMPLLTSPVGQKCPATGYNGSISAIWKYLKARPTNLKHSDVYGLAASCPTMTKESSESEQTLDIVQFWGNVQWVTCACGIEHSKP